MNPVEILSKKSPEKLLLPHPTDLDLETLLLFSKDEAETPLLAATTTLSSSTTACPILDRECLESLSRALCGLEEEERDMKDQNPPLFLGL